LQAAVFTRDISKAYRFVEELAVGQVVVNDSTCWWDINMPFGGAGGRRTGWGRIGGKHTLLGMTDLRTAAIQLLAQNYAVGVHFGSLDGRGARMGRRRRPVPPGSGGICECLNTIIHTANQNYRMRSHRRQEHKNPQIPLPWCAELLT
jgi:hypothetical protein